MAYEVYIPVISSASFSVNPAKINARIVLTVKVIDSRKTLEAEKLHSGEINAGEV